MLRWPQIQGDAFGKTDFVIQNAKPPLGIEQAVRGRRVTTRGRTTGVTRGKVVDTNFRVRLNYPGVGTVGFREKVLCERYTQGGDSGSIVVDVATGKIVSIPKILQRLLTAYS